jgi:hypothetical protein
MRLRQVSWLLAEQRCRHPSAEDFRATSAGTIQAIIDVRAGAAYAYIYFLRTSTLYEKDTLQCRTAGLFSNVGPKGTP